MGKTIMGAVMSLGGFMADDNEGIVQGDRVTHFVYDVSR